MNSLDNSKQRLRDYLNKNTEHEYAFKKLSEKSSSLAIMDNIGNTFQSRGAAIKGLIGITAGSFNPSDILRKTEDFKGGENMDIVGAVQLSKNKDSIELQKAYQEALNEQAGIEAQITGFRSEQQTNTNCNNTKPNNSVYISNPKN